MMEKEKFRLQFITHSNETYSSVDSACLALKGGCRWIQLRMKEATADEVIPAAITISEMCHRYNATFIIDDHVELVKTTGADGVHLGLKDMPIKEARRILGPNYIIGGTANTFQNVEQHYHDGADYIGCGPFRFTTTKKNLSPILGIEGYKQIKEQMNLSGIDIPIVAIGGITIDDIPAIISADVDGIAISGGILNAADPSLQTAEVLKVINRSIDNKTKE